MAKEFPNDDARKCIADNLKVWMINKDNFDKDAYTQEGEQIIRAAIRDNLNESENPDYIVCKGQEISLDDNNYEWLDNDTFLFIIPADKKLIDEDEDEYYISCEWHEDEQKFIFEARYDDDFINLDKQNSYLTMNDKELIMAKMKKIISKTNIKENLNEASNGIENIADALMQGAKKGFEPIEYGNWICTTSLDDKWESFSPVMKDYLLKEISYQVNTGDLEFEDLEISIDGDDCDKAMLDENDIKALGMFDDEEIEEMINAEFKPLTFLISYNIEFDNKINEDLNMKKATKKALKESVEIKSETSEVVESTTDEQFKVKDKKKKKKKIDDNLDKKVGNMKKLTEDAYKVYNTIENRECGTFNSWNDVENFLNQEWGSYSADKAKENPNFGSEEDKANFFGNYSMDVVQLPVAVEPETNCDICDCEPDTCGGCADIEVPDDAEVIEIPAEVAAKEPVEIDVEVAPLDLDAFINTLVDEPEVEEPQTDDTEETCADCGCNPCECTTVIASDIIEESKKPLKEDEGIDAFDDEDKEYEFRTVRKNALANPNAYEGRYTQSDIRVARKAYADDIEAAKAQEQAKNDLAKTEEFKDNMGMLTDINDTDFPDALKQAVDTKEDGSLYRISDIAKELEELKASFKQEIESIKQDIKTTLTDIKQDIKSDVKDIQTDVTSKLDNTNSKIADLTSEEGLDDEELDLENEAPVDTEEELDLENEPAEEETTEETDEDELTEAEKRAFVQNYVKQNSAIYEQIKNVIRTSKLEGKKMSVPTIAEKLREDYGLDTRAGVVYDNVSMICEYTPVSKYIIDPDTEKALMKTQSLGLANRFIKSGLQDVWANNKQQENLSNLDTVLSSKAENLDQAKKAIDKFANQDGNAEKIKKAIELTTDNDQEKEQALDYAIDKIDESYSTDSVMSKLLNARGTLGNITAVQGIGFKSIPKK